MKVVVLRLKFHPKDPINNMPLLVEIMAWRRTGDKPLSESMTLRFLYAICTTKPRWVKNDGALMDQTRRKLKTWEGLTQITAEHLSCHISLEYRHFNLCEVIWHQAWGHIPVVNDHVYVTLAPLWGQHFPSSTSGLMTSLGHRTRRTRRHRNTMMILQLSQQTQYVLNT